MPYRSRKSAKEKIVKVTPVTDDSVSDELDVNKIKLKKGIREELTFESDEDLLDLDSCIDQEYEKILNDSDWSEVDNLRKELTNSIIETTVNLKANLSFINQGEKDNTLHITDEEKIHLHKLTKSFNTDVIEVSQRIKNTHNTHSSKSGKPTDIDDTYLLIEVFNSYTYIFNSLIPILQNTVAEILTTISTIVDKNDTDPSVVSDAIIINDTSDIEKGTKGE